jgi:hypothetical protein
MSDVVQISSERVDDIPLIVEWVLKLREILTLEKQSLAQY